MESVLYIRKSTFVRTLQLQKICLSDVNQEKAGLIDWKTMNKKSTELLKDLQIDAKATDKLEECSLAKQQMIAIARAVDMNCRVLILDEPTSSLDDDEVEKIIRINESFESSGSWNYLRYTFPGAGICSL